MKTYSAQSGYVYQYFYKGHRGYSEASDSGTEYVFHVSSGRQEWYSISVFVGEEAVRGWQEEHARTLSATECYAVAKLALFQAFDERAEPERMKEPVLVHRSDMDGMIETLGL